MESQPQNPEFRDKPENFHPWITKTNSLRKTPYGCYRGGGGGGVGWGGGGGQKESLTKVWHASELSFCEVQPFNSNLWSFKICKWTETYKNFDKWAFPFVFQRIWLAYSMQRPSVCGDCTLQIVSFLVCLGKLTVYVKKFSPFIMVTQHQQTLLRENLITTNLQNRSRGYKTFFMLNSTEHEISTVHKN